MSFFLPRGVPPAEGFESQAVGHSKSVPEWKKKGRRASRAPTPEGKQGKNAAGAPSPHAAGGRNPATPLSNERCTVVARPLKKGKSRLAVGNKKGWSVLPPPRRGAISCILKKGVVALEAPQPFLSSFRLAFPPPKGLKAKRWVTLRVSQSRRKKKPRGSKSSHAKSVWWLVEPLGRVQFFLSLRLAFPPPKGLKARRREALRTSRKEKLNTATGLQKPPRRGWGGLRPPPP